MTTAIIVAAGSSRRMGFDKLFAPLAGRSVIAHSIAAFELCPEIHDILLVVKRDKVGAFKELVQAEGFKKVRKVIAGGAERHLSVWRGLKAVNATAQYVAIHDGARPLTTPELIRECLALARETGAACCASQVPDTVKRADEKQIVSDDVERSGLWAMQTPQIFSTAVILQAYAGIIANKETVTDEVSAVQRLGKKISLLRNDEWNFKITLPRDLELAEHVLVSRGRR
ncbi:MAG: 2-C-methyl-D-erythritol 4-phosphate cytidylyltransferase [Chthoniobacter sp.]|jgi:2-C-methyl-D-erythritol 4-phosphate cytidylyltransferase|nr:2-C-methyl-D-erythritol 4-phosphate cytidylyltransferase [Chthoniobacter sp.]